MTANEKSLQVWNFLSEKYAASNDGVLLGKMMSAPALTFGGKVFAFHSARDGGLGCRLGRDFDVEKLGLTQWAHLAPFKTKPPMKDWIIIGLPDIERWDEIIQIALDLAKEHNAQS